jgi:hypothetical protein
MYVGGATMRKSVLAFVFTAALLAAMAVPLFGGTGTTPSALASQPQFDFFDMNDRFASETTGANGFARIRHTQEGSIEIAMVQVENLLPNHPYELQVTIQLAVPGDFTGDIDIVTSGAITTNPDGHLLIKKVDLGSVAKGDYRLDLFVTHTHSTDPGSGPTGEFLTTLMDRDPLLACQPAPVVTVE